jgi:protein-arginine kinase activator protein McsA
MKVLMGSIIVAVILVMSSCIFVAGTHKHEECPVCEECSEGEEDPYLCSKYYADKEEPQLQTGSFDFFLEEEDKMTSSTLATKCQTCGIYFTHPSYGEHIKTCCP